TNINFSISNNAYVSWQLNWHKTLILLDAIKPSGTRKFGLGMLNYYYSISEFIVSPKPTALRVNIDSLLMYPRSQECFVSQAQAHAGSLFSLVWTTACMNT